MSMELSCDGRRTDNATWADVEAVLPELKGETFFRLTILPRPEVGPRELEIQAANGNYMVAMAGSRGTGGSLHNPGAKGGEHIEMLGYDYPPEEVTQDYDHIVRMIREFFHTGDIPDELFTIQPENNG